MLFFKIKLSSKTSFSNVNPQATPVKFGTTGTPRLLTDSVTEMELLAIITKVSLVFCYGR